MKKVFLMLFATSLFIQSCKPVKYKAYFDKQNTTEVVLSQSNFKVLGHFTGKAIVKKTTYFKGSEGLLAKAREDLLKNAEEAGYPLTGSRTLINISVDFIESKTKIKAVISADMIEFK
jgi:hypothetical protein